INPDAAEVLVKENIHYAAVRPIKEEDSFTLLVGNTFYMVKDMDYVFAPYPEEISLSSNRDVVAKKRITTFSKTEFQLEYNDILYYLLDEKRLEDARRFLDTQVRYQPESDEWAYGFADLGYTHLCNAEFDLALDCYRQARSIDPNNPASETRFFDVLVATNALAEARDYCRQQFSETSLRMYWMTQDVLLTNRLDGEDAANILAVQYRKALDKAASPNQMEWIDDWERWLMIDLAYQRDNLDVYLSLLDKNNPKEVFQAAISTTILPSPASYETSENAFTYFLVYLAAVRSGAENPDDYFNKAVRLTADPNSENLQELLQTSPLNTSSICALELDPVEKTIMLTALGVKYPQHRDVFFSLARRLNHYSLEFPHLFLRSLHES
ncbi:MAG: hypothetical protein JW709_08315, partial [Sedimentisphaerales bacterium]|nr:hypothetical protein [Sedimentisphaerales bacterium]